MKIRYKPFCINRMISIHRGVDAHIEANQIEGYVGEWVVVPLEMGEGAVGQLRLPLEAAMEQGLVVAVDAFEFHPEDELIGSDD